MTSPTLSGLLSFEDIPGVVSGRNSLPCLPLPPPAAGQAGFWLCALRPRCSPPAPARPAFLRTGAPFSICCANLFNSIYPHVRHSVGGWVVIDEKTKLTDQSPLSETWASL